MTRILEAVAESAQDEGISRVKNVRLIVGPRSGALPDALRFAFEVLAGSGDGGTGADDETHGGKIKRLFSGAVLDIEEPPVLARCRRCGLEYSEEETTGDPGDPEHGRPADFGGEMAWAFICPRCGSPAPEFLSGNELLIDFYEGE